MPPATAVPPAITLEDITVRIGPATLVDGVRFAVMPGGVVGLIGPNGAGKSTVVKVAAGVLAPNAGRVARADPKAPIGYLPQDGPVHWQLTVDRVVALGRLPHLSAFARPGPEDRAAITAALAATDTRTLAGRRIDTLSGGERARVLLARVLAGEPQVMLVDEPVAGLDPRHQLETMELLRAQAAQGRAVLVVLHDLLHAARFCDRLVLLDRGRVVIEGPPPAVLTPARIAAVYGVTAMPIEVDGIALRLPWRRAGGGSDQPGPTTAQ